MRASACVPVGLMLGIAFVLPAAPTAAQRSVSMTSRKIIEFGWDMPSPAYLRDNMRAMEKTPFDGVAIRLSEAAGGGNVFDVRKWEKTTPEAREKERKTMEEIPRSDRLTDNFVTIYGASTMDWFSDDDWKRVLENVRYCAQVARAGRCKGVVWDPEPYSGRNPWRLPEQPGHENRTFAQYYEQARKRGAQFMTALQEAFPGLTILSLRQFSDFQDGSPFSARLLPLRGKSDLEKSLSEAWWGLHVPFTVGMLEAMAPGVTLVDGNEDAYYYTSPLDYFRIYHTLRQEALAFVPAALHAKYATQYRVGHAVSIDYCAGNWAEALNFPDYLKKQALDLTPEERARWFEHNLYYALTTSEGYVWVYGEDMNWWTGEKIPPGIEEAIRSARRKYEAGQPLGFSVEEKLAQIRARRKP